MRSLHFVLSLLLLLSFCRSSSTGINDSCPFFLPDTALSGIHLRNPKSTIAIIGDSDKLYDDERYHYYSLSQNETLSLTPHPGDSKHSISLFEVRYSDKADHGYRILTIKQFSSEKGIRLGLSKKQIIQKLGNCYIAKDSTDGYLEMYYRIEQPNDSKSRLLQRHNMPVYYASYKLWNDKPGKFEFGFEYP